jgi:hypothetical protein
VSQNLSARHDPEDGKGVLVANKLILGSKEKGVEFLYSSRGSTSLLFNWDKAPMSRVDT